MKENKSDTPICDTLIQGLGSISARLPSTKQVIEPMLQLGLVIIVSGVMWKGAGLMVKAGIQF